MKIAFTSDWHFDNNRNLPRAIQTAEWVGEMCQKNDIKHMIIPGDLCNTANKIDVLALNKMTDILSKWKEMGIETNILVGNHEQYYKNDDSKDHAVTSLHCFKKYANIYDKFTIIQSDDMNVFYVPYVTSEAFFEQIITQARLAIELNKRNILVAHQEVYGAIMNDLAKTVSPNGIKHDIFEHFDFSFFGHFHSRQMLTDYAIMVGSPYMQNFGEDFNDKGITIYDTNTNTIEFIENPHSQLYTSLTPDMDYKDQVKDKYVRFLLSEKLDVEEIENLKKTALTYGALNVITLPCYTNKDNELNNIKIDINKADIHEIAKKYIELKKGDLNEMKLFKLYNEILTGVDE